MRTISMLVLGAVALGGCPPPVYTPPVTNGPTYGPTGTNDGVYGNTGTGGGNVEPDAGINPTYPKVIISIPEFHITRSRVPDPAAETEFTNTFINAGYNVLDKKQAEKVWKDDVLYKLEKEEDLSAAAALAFKAGAEVLIIGEAFSEAGTVNRTYTGGIATDLYSCAARVEVKVIKASNGRILFAYSETAKAVNTTEVIAGKDALAKAGLALSKKAADKLAKVWGDDVKGGGNMIEVIISIPNGDITFGQANSFREAAAKSIPGVKQIVMREFIEGAAPMEFVFEGDAQGLAAQMDGKKIDGRKCKVTKVQEGKIFVNLQ